MADTDEETETVQEPAPLLQILSMAEVQVLADAAAPGLVSAPYRLAKAIFIERLTSEEAGQVETILGEDANLRLWFNSLDQFVSDDPSFGALSAALVAVLTTTRADELLIGSET